MSAAVQTASTPDDQILTTDENGRQWYNEVLHEGFKVSYEVTGIVYDSKTTHQRLVVADTVTFGRIVSLDGITQVTTADEYAYHEMLAHTPILAHGAARRVLIIGGGDGGMAEEVLKHKSVEHLTMVEIDASVVDFAREHLPDINKNCFDDDRFHLVIADGRVFAAESGERFDVIIIDSTDPIGPGEVLFSSQFYTDCKRLLDEGGVLVTQNGVPYFQADELRNTIYNFTKLFADARCYLGVVPTYIGGFMAFGWGTDDKSLRKVPLKVLKKRFKESAINTRYYSPKVHKAAFALPGFIADLVKDGRNAAKAG